MVTWRGLIWNGVIRSIPTFCLQIAPWVEASSQTSEVCFHCQECSLTESPAVQMAKRPVYTCSNRKGCPKRSFPVLEQSCSGLGPLDICAYHHGLYLILLACLTKGSVNYSVLKAQTYYKAQGNCNTEDFILNMFTMLTSVACHGDFWLDCFSIPWQ